jgi:hypothetical protein
MSARITLSLLVGAAAAALVAATSSIAFASSSATASATAAKPKVVPIVMADPGCHWFQVNGKKTAKFVAKGPVAFRNFDEAALIFKGMGSTRNVPVGKTLTVSKRGVYHITMVKQHPDDNHLLLVVK